MALAIMLALLPLVELVDQWESFGSDPEFVSVCTMLGITFGILAAIRRAILLILYCLRRLPSGRFALSAGAVLTRLSADIIQAVFPRIRTPIRI